MLGQPLPDFAFARTGGAVFRLSAVIGFPFEFRPDCAEALCERFGAKKVPARKWRGVKVRGHPQEVLNFAKAL